MWRLTSGAQTRLWQLLAPALAFVVTILLWQMFLRIGQIPQPSSIWNALRSSHATLLDDTVATFWEEALRGYVIGCALGFVAPRCVCASRCCSAG